MSQLLFLGTLSPDSPPPPSHLQKITNRENRIVSAGLLFSLTKRVPDSDLARACDRSRDEILKLKEWLRRERREG